MFLSDELKTSKEEVEKLSTQNKNLHAKFEENLALVKNLQQQLKVQKADVSNRDWDHIVGKMAYLQNVTYFRLALLSW